MAMILPPRDFLMKAFDVRGASCRQNSASSREHAMLAIVTGVSRRALLGEFARRKRDFDATAFITSEDRRRYAPDDDDQRDARARAKTTRPRAGALKKRAMSARNVDVSDAQFDRSR